jgi:glycosyltransferase involved in cell wall biosynthesis
MATSDITVVIASFRYGHLAAQAVDSVIAQTEPPAHILFVDDGVGDCRHIGEIYPEVEFIERDQNLGTVANFNDMLARVETRRVLFLGADNWLRLDALEVLAPHEADIVSYDIALSGSLRRGFADVVAATTWRHGHPIWRFDPNGDMNAANVIHGSSLYNAALGRAQGYAASGNAQTEEDWVLFRRMLSAGATHEHVAEPLLYYRRHRENYNPS